VLSYRQHLFISINAEHRLSKLDRAECRVILMGAIEWGDATMTDTRFFHTCGPFDLKAVASCARGAAVSDDRILTGVAALQTAGPSDVSFLDGGRYLGLLGQSLAGAIIVHPDFKSRLPPSAVAIVTPEPYAAWARVCALFHPPVPVQPGIHPSAVVEEGASIDPSCEIGPNAVVGRNAVIGARSVVGPAAVIGPAVVVGTDCRIGAQVTLSHAIIGSRVQILPGARIGQDGFGFAVTSGVFLSVAQLGRVIIEDDVEIGANTTIDRGSARDTIVGSGTRIDNLVQIGHNVVLGRQCIVVAQVGIAGSTTVGDFTRIGGQAAIAGHVSVGMGVQIGAQAGVISDVEDGAVLLGSPAQPKRDFLRQIITLKRIERQSSGRHSS
jgi:UDP-3-O-[3-hydroxymyristoyl] glucosamine N-acyltransferase